MTAARDTIYALSSGRPPAAIAVVRISGPRARVALERLSGRLPEPRKAALARLRNPTTGDVIDEALSLWFPAPASETGEDVAELQMHGGRAVIAAVFAALGAIDGLRPAEAGEFTRRAFENGKLDLTAVEGLADLIYAETEAQRRQAYRQLKGLLGERAESWRARLIEALALVEARIDFSDEADVPEELLEPALKIAAGLRAEIAEALAGAARGERLRHGLVVAIAGPPNAGKSTLLNRIARREAAIVSPIPGTTRDVIEVHLDHEGYPVTLLDTAGIRDSSDPVEQEGVRRATARAAEADLVIWVEENARHQVSDARRIAAGLEQREPDASRGRLGQGGRIEASPAAVWRVLNKVDLDKNNSQELTNGPSLYDFKISALTGEGADALLGALGRHASDYFGTEPALVSRERQRKSLEIVHAALDRALSQKLQGKEDLVAEELRHAAATLGKLTGRIDVEDILDVIFRDFCIGK
jgi:tRNA modification GTPase